MRRETVIEIRRHVRAIDIALKKDIDQSGEKAEIANCGHLSCDPKMGCKYTLPHGVVLTGAEK